MAVRLVFRAYTGGEAKQSETVFVYTSLRIGYIAFDTNARALVALCEPSCLPRVDREI